MENVCNESHTGMIKSIIIIDDEEQKVTRKNEEIKILRDFINAMNPVWFYFDKDSKTYKQAK